jgi:hypothetical protein
MEMRGCEAWLKALRRRKVQHDIIKIGVMLSLSKHSGRGLCARVFDRLRLTGPLLSFHFQSSQLSVDRVYGFTMLVVCNYR